MMGVLEGSRMKNGAFVFYCSAVEYCENCYYLNEGFGCTAIRKGNYMILNKEYSKEEYFKLKEKIEEQLKKDGTYGQFFPPQLAPFGYNETLAQDFFPLSKEEAIRRGFWWQEKITGTYNQATIKKGEIPSLIRTVGEAILSEILVCETCNKNFKIMKAEFDFYKRMNLSLPHKDFECRHKERMAKRNPRKLWHRKCQCAGKVSENGVYTNAAEHQHAVGHCQNEFETSYSPDRKEVIYCEACYQAEVA